jgi:hypothetical protein
MLEKVRVTVEFIHREGGSIFKVREVGAAVYVGMDHQFQQDHIAFMARTAHAELRNVIYRGGLSDEYYSLPSRRSSDGVHELGEAGESDGEGADGE